MNQSLLSRIRLLGVGVFALFVMVLFTACGVAGTDTGIGTGTGATGNITGITGQVVSVNPSAHSVVVAVNGTEYTIGGLSDQEVTTLQSAVSKTWHFQVTGSNGSYTITTGTTPQEQDNSTPEVNVTPENNGNQGTGAVEPGSISFDGIVQSVSPNSISVKMPNGNVLSMSISTLTDRGDFGTALPANGQWVKVDAVASQDGNFTAKSLDSVKPDDQANPTKINKVDFQGVTTSAVGSSGVIKFNVGNKSYSFTIGSAQIKDFPSAQAISIGQNVKVTVMYSGSTALVQEVKSGNS